MAGRSREPNSPRRTAAQAGCGYLVVEYTVLGIAFTIGGGGHGPDWPLRVYQVVALPGTLVGIVCDKIGPDSDIFQLLSLIGHTIAPIVNVLLWVAWSKRRLFHRSRSPGDHPRMKNDLERDSDSRS
jgi:hypothetical protein